MFIKNPEMMLTEVVGLALHWSDAACLECNPLLGSTRIILIFERELEVWVVVAGHVCEDSSSFEDREVVAVMVDYGGNSSVRVDFCKPRLLLDILHDIDALDCVVFAIGFLFHGQMVWVRNDLV